MRPVSDAYLRTVRSSHQIKVRATVTTTFQTGVSPTGTEIPILAGTVTLDGSADVRSTLDLVTDGTGMWPDAANDLLAPYGNEVHIARAVVYGNGTEEWVSLGFYRVDTPDQDLPPDGPIRIEAPDRMQGIVDGRLTRPRQYPSTATYGDIVEELVTDVYPSATVEWDDATDTDTTGRALIVEEDRYAFLRDLATSLGKVAYWDHRGILVVHTPPDPAEPVFEVDHGAGGVLVGLRRRLTRRGVYNAVVALGEAADTETPVRALSTDNNPTSPTYYSGPFGPVPMFWASPFITTVTQARSAATSLLKRQLGLPYNVDFAMVPNVALEPDDPVRVRYSDRHTSEVHVLETLTIPLTPEEPMSATTREKAVILIDTTTS